MDISVGAFGGQKMVPYSLRVRVTDGWVLGTKLKSAAGQYELIITETSLQAQERILCTNLRERTDRSRT